MTLKERIYYLKELDALISRCNAEIEYLEKYCKDDESTPTAIGAVKSVITRIEKMAEDF